MSNTTQPTKGQVNQNQGQIVDVQARTIEQIRTQGLDPSILEKIHADKAEMDKLEKEQSERIKGNYISFKEDHETKTLLFTGKYQKLNCTC